MKDFTVKLSVFVMTYNHDKFIQNTLDKIIVQKVNFNYEIIIGDDSSSDNTIAILQEYKNRFPDKIKLLLHRKNIGAMQNQVQTFANCNGEYIAICEGDDYWCDENKLQKQVNFLDANPGYAICFHQVYDLETNGKTSLSNHNTSEKEETYSIEDLASFNFIHTPSVVFRNGFIKMFPEWFYQATIGDYVLHLLNAKHGLIKYFPQPMAVYRRHQSGSWSGADEMSRAIRWIGLLDLLIKEDFNDTVISNLKIQRSKKADHYLRMVYKSEPEKFLEQLKIFAADDDYIRDKWLYKHYPEYIRKLKADLHKFRNHWAYKLIRKFRS